MVGLSAYSFATSAPYHLRNGATLDLSCGVQGADGTLLVVSEDGGLSAQISFREQTFHLRFDGHFLFKDYYSDGAVSLTLDPEGHLSGVSNGPAGTCVL